MTFALEQYRHVHFVGIGGIGMSALARLLVAQGYEVSGSDRVMGEQCKALRRMGVTVRVGHRARNAAGADLIVVTSAAAADNSETVWARDHGIPIVKRAQLLGAMMNPRRGVAVAG